MAEPQADRGYVDQAQEARGGFVVAGGRRLLDHVLERFAMIRCPAQGTVDGHPGGGLARA